MIDKQFIVNLKGKDYPTWPGVLDAATKAGLKSLTTTLIQSPSPENNHTAIVLARAEFDGGRVFEDLGDASPANCSAQIATAAIRMASTRAKGRTLRDAINVGQTMFEELPDLNGGADTETPSRPHESRREPVQSNGSPIACCAPGCGVVLTPAQATYSQKKWAMSLCPEHQREQR